MPELTAIGEEIGGEDVARPRLQVTLEQTKAKLRELHAGYSDFIQPFALPEPEEADLEKVREIVRRAEER